MFRDPSRDCPLCPRLVAFHADNRAAHPDWHNAPVPAFGPLDARLLIVGLAPGLRGANRTGRPFTGDYAGDLLYVTLLKFGLAKGSYDQRADDGLSLQDCRITNAVRCVPPQNKPSPAEAKTCGKFLKDEINSLKHITSILALGRISHEATLRALGLKPGLYPFGHAKIHDLPSGIRLVDSYHCSRYNTQTNRLTVSMFEDAVRAAAKH
ncbi:MAG: uracil-DNA glycosylase [Alphaproteobacteria bacterium]|nr:uracil-DNA glycosylase [Alphaproteobacteria bacterium]